MSEEYIPPTGPRYSQLFTARGPALDDSERARRRVFAIFEADLLSSNRDRNRSFGVAIKRVQGISIRSNPYLYHYEEFFMECDLRDLFDAITTIHSVLIASTTYGPNWIRNVNNVFIEENLSVRVDTRGVVIPDVDVAFSLNRDSLLQGLNNPSLASVLNEVQDAFDDLKASNPDTKDAVRAIFDAIEIYVKLRIGGSSISSLSSNIVSSRIRPIVMEMLDGDVPAQNASGLLLNSLSKWVDAAQIYRHGQPSEEPTPPPLDVAILFVNQGAGFLRWLLGYLEDD